MRVLFGTILALCALLTAARAEGAHVRAAVLVTSPQDRALTERIRGQTSDLDAEITVVDALRVAPTFEARMREADTVARRSSSNAVFWFRVTGGVVVVYVSVPAQDRVLVRPLGGGAGKVSSSTLEAAALVVRDVLRALGEGATVGELRGPPSEREEALLAPPLFGCAPPACAAPASPLGLPAPSFSRPAIAFVSSAGWQATRARDAPSIVHAVDLRLGAQYERVSASLVLTLGGVDVERVTERAELLVRRHSLALAAAVTKALGPDVDGSLGLMAGGLSFIHASRSLSPMFLAGEARHHLRMFVAPEGRVAWSVAPTLALALTVGLDVVVNAPRFAVVTAPGRTGVYELAELQPRLGLALEWGRPKYR